MKGILTVADEAQKKLSKSLQKEDLYTLYGQSIGEALWEKYRGQKKDIWSFFLILDKTQRGILRTWIDQQLENMDLLK